MLKVAKTPAERRLANFFNVQAVVGGSLEDPLVRAVRDLLRECPDCLRAYNLLAVSDALGPSRLGAESGPAVANRTLRKRLLDISGLPQPIIDHLRDAGADLDAAQEVAFHKAVIAALKAAGTPELDRGEPSLSSIAQTIEEIDFAQLVVRLEFLRNSLGVSVTEMLATYGPLYRAHPDAGFLSSFSRNRREEEAGAAALAKNLELYAVTMNDRRIIQWWYSITPTPHVHAVYALPGRHCDSIFLDDLRCMSADFFGPPDDPKNGSFSMLQAWGTSNKLPVAVAMRISRDWPRAKTEVEKYERDYADDPNVQNALAKRFMSLKRWNDADAVPSGTCK